MKALDNREVSAREATPVLRALMSKPDWESKLSEEEVAFVRTWIDWVCGGSRSAPNGRRPLGPDRMAGGTPMTLEDLLIGWAHAEDELRAARMDFRANLRQATEGTQCTGGGPADNTGPEWELATDRGMAICDVWHEEVLCPWCTSVVRPAYLRRKNALLERERARRKVLRAARRVAAGMDVVQRLRPMSVSRLVAELLDKGGQ